MKTRRVRSKFAVEEKEYEINSIMPVEIIMVMYSAHPEGLFPLKQ